MVYQGKLPEAFYRIEDLEAQRFVGICLANVSKRLPAKELLLDPFLAPVQLESPRPPPPCLPSPFIQIHKPNSHNAVVSKVHSSMADQTKGTNMTITGTLNEEDDTVFLKVQISDKNGIALCRFKIAALHVSIINLFPISIMLFQELFL